MMTYLKIFINGLKNEIILKNCEYAIAPLYGECRDISLYDIFSECDDLKDREYLRVTDYKNKVDPKMSYKAKADFDVRLDIVYMFVPYSCKLYFSILLDFNNAELVQGIFSDEIFEVEKYWNYIRKYVVNKIYENKNIDNEIVFNNFYDTREYKYCQDNEKWPLNAYCSDRLTEFEYVGDRPILSCVAKQDIISELNRELNKAYNMLKMRKNIDYNSILLKLKRRYIDFINITENINIWNGRKNDYIDKMNKKLNIDALNEEYINKFNTFEDIVKSEVDQKNIILADTLNTIQIASMVLTIVGWVLVVLQHDLPSKTPIYLFAILLCSFVSVTIAIFIKRVLDKK